MLRCPPTGRPSNLTGGQPWAHQFSGLTRLGSRGGWKAVVTYLVALRPQSRAPLHPSTRDLLEGQTETFTWWRCDEKALVPSLSAIPVCSGRISDMTASACRKSTRREMHSCVCHRVDAKHEPGLAPGTWLHVRDTSGTNNISRLPVYTCRFKHSHAFGLPFSPKIKPKVWCPTKGVISCCHSIQVLHSNTPRKVVPHSNRHTRTNPHAIQYLLSRHPRTRPPPYTKPHNQ